MQQSKVCLKTAGCNILKIVRLAPSSPREKINSLMMSDIRTVIFRQMFTAAGDKFKSRYVISAMPVTLLNRITFSPPLPSLKLQMFQRMPMSSIVKTVMFYDKPYWRLKGFSGQMTTDKGPVQYCVDDTKPDGSAPCLMGFILADRVCYIKYKERSG